MSVFLYTYDDPAHYDLARTYGVVGAPAGGAGGLETKFLKLRRGDFIVLRDSSVKREMHILGVHRVLASAFEQSVNAPFKPLLWPREVESRHMFYPLRVVVDPMSLDHTESISWGEMDFGGTNKKGDFLETASQWGQLFRGNFVAAEHAPQTLMEKLGLPTDLWR